MGKAEDWVHCEKFADAVGESIGTGDDPAEWFGKKVTPNAPCGHNEHHFLDEVPPRFLGRVNNG